MWVTVHVCSGLGLASLSRRPKWWVVPAAIVLHGLLDAVPHWDYTRDRRRVLWAALDLAAAALVVGAAARVARGRPGGGTAILAGGAAALPDIEIVDGLFPNRSGTSTPKAVRHFPSHKESFPHGDATVAAGILTQVVVGVVSLIVFFRRFTRRPGTRAWLTVRGPSVMP